MVLAVAACTYQHLRWWEQFLHPGETRTCGGYWFYSGLFALSYISAPFVMLAGMYHHLNCHVDGCRKLGHNDPAVHAPACRDHHSLGALHGKVPANRA